MSKIIKPVTKHVVLTGIRDIMFDRYPGDNTTKLNPDQKMYLDDARRICLPTLNMVSFLTATNTESAPMATLGKEARRVASALLCSIDISPSPLIHIMRNNKPIVFGEFDENGKDKKSAAYVFHGKTIVKKAGLSIPQPKDRPVLPLPWSLSFDITIAPHPELTLTLIENLFTNGGMRLGLGTFRKMFGKFEFAWT